MFASEDIEHAFMFRGRLFVVLRTGSIYRFDGYSNWLSVGSIYT